MNPTIKKFLPKIHLLVYLYALWSFLGVYEEFDVQNGQIVNQKEGLQSEITKLKSDLQDVKKFTENLDESKKRVENVFQTIDKIQRQLPSELSDLEILDYFSKEKKTLNVPDLNAKALPEKDESFYIIKPFEISGKSTFLQFLVILERLSYSERIFNIKDFQVETPSEPQKGRYHLVNFKAKVETYRYNSNFKEESGIQDLAGGETPTTSATGGGE